MYNKVYEHRAKHLAEVIHIMEIKIINQEEKNFFNDFMANGPKSHILQSYEWGEVKHTDGINKTPCNG